MKFWKLEVNGNDFLLFYKNHKRVNKVTLCSERMGAGAHGWVEVRIQKEDIVVDIYAEDGNDSDLFYDGIRCCAYWYMILFEKEYCSIAYKEQHYNLRRWKNLITLETMPQYKQHPVEIKHTMKFRYPDMKISNPHVYVETYCDAYQHHLLHRIAIGVDQSGMNLMRYSQGHVYLSAIVHMIYEGKLFDNS